MSRIFPWIKEHKKIAIIGTLLITLFIIIGFVADYVIKQSRLPEIVPYETFEQDLADGHIVSIDYGSSEYMTVVVDNDKVYRTQYPAYDDFRKDMLESGVELHIVANDTATLGSIISVIINIAFYGLMILIFAPMVKEMVGKGSFSEKNLMQTSSVRFDDIIGLDEIRADVEFAADMLKNPGQGSALGAASCRGILFDGDPGCGKTLIAKAIAGEAGVPFISVSGSSFIEKYVGVGAQRVRKVFDLARKKAPCVVFIDEIDAVAGKRGQDAGEHDQTVNALLTEMDGFSGRDGVLVIAATNRADMLDDAVVRAGRFDRKITIRKPKDWTVRKQMFEHYLKDKPIADDVDMDCIAKQTANYSGADISTACNEAATIALQRGLSYITMDCLEEAVDRKIFGGSRTRNALERNHDKEIIAYHEAGHAVATFLLGQPIARISIIGNTSGVGGAVFREDDDSCFISKKQLEDTVKIAYAGRASEEIKFGADNITTGASNDITQATVYLTSAVNRYGFYGNCGLLDADVLNKIGCKPQTIDVIKDKSEEFYMQTVNMIRENYDKVEKLAQVLMERETMTGAEAVAILSDKIAA